MYLSEDDMEGTELRQGDVLLDIFLLGAININGIQKVVDAGDNAVSWTVPRVPQFGPAAVLSHSCEIDKANGVKLTSVILGPIRDINEATPPEKRQQLIESNVVQEADGASFLKYFYLPPHANIPFENGAVIDFSKLFSVRKNYFDELVARKVLQLTSEARDQMALKLGLYFFRTSS